MNKVYYPTGLLNSDGVAGLAPEYKMLLAGTAVHKEMMACGVIRLTDYVLASLGFLPREGVAAAIELQRRGRAVFDETSREFFAKGFFETNQTPAESGLGSPWAKQVELAISRIKLEVVAQAVNEDIDLHNGKPKLASAGVPTNILTALPRLAYGKSWQKSERLVLLALYTDTSGHAAGLPVVDYDAIGALCSLPGETVLECCDTLNAGEAIGFDRETGEAIVFSKIKHATDAEAKSIQLALPDVHSTQVKRAASRYLKRRFSTRIPEFSTRIPESAIKSTTSVPKEKKENFKREESKEKASEAQASPAPALSSLRQKIEQMKNRGKTTKELNAELEAKNAAIIENLAAKLGDEAVLSVIYGCQYLSAAVKETVSAGLDEKAERADKAAKIESEQEAEQARRREVMKKPAGKEVVARAAALLNGFGRRHASA